MRILLKRRNFKKKSYSDEFKSLLTEVHNMPARDIYHNSFKNALIKDGWTITHDPLRLSLGSKDMYVDLGAERLLAAEKEDQKIAVEIKSFVGDSEMDDFEKAIGQYVVYYRGRT